jgi:hypothetical protein
MVDDVSTLPLQKDGYQHEEWSADRSRRHNRHVSLDGSDFSESFQPPLARGGGQPDEAAQLRT